ncbi:unnamed protein product, partial [Gulo gulo]
SRKCALPQGQRNLSASVKRVTKLLFCRTAIRKSQYMEIHMKICQEPSVEMPRAILKLTSPVGYQNVDWPASEQ